MTDNNVCESQNNLLSKGEGTRNSVFELLRIISMFLIVAYHAGRDITLSKLTTVNAVFFSSIASWGLVGVNLFVMISAWFLCEQKFKTTKLLRLVFEVFTYVLAIDLIKIGYDFYKTRTIYPAIKSTILHHWVSFWSPFWSNEYWFITSYIFMLILSPFINKICDTLTNKGIKILLLCLAFIPIYSNFYSNFLEGTVVRDTAYFCYVYLLICYVKRTNFSFKKKFMHVLAYVIMILIVVGEVYTLKYSAKLENSNNAIVRNGIIIVKKILVMTLLNTGRDSLIILIVSFLIFNSVLKIKPFSSKFINAISACTLGVYLFHENLFFNMCDMFFIKAKSMGIITYNAVFPLSYIAVVLAIYIVGTIFELVRYNIIQKPFNKMLKKHSGKFERIDKKINV